MAVTDPLRLSLNPLPVQSPDTLLPYLKSYVAAEQVDAVVLGLPLNLKGEDTHATAAVRLLYTRLQTELAPIRVDLYDERFTSKMASRLLVQAGLKRKDRRDKGRVDTTSALILLQNYLEYLTQFPD